MSTFKWVDDHRTGSLLFLLLDLNLLLNLLGRVQVDVKVDELCSRSAGAMPWMGRTRVLLDEIVQAEGLQVLFGLLLQVQTDARAAAKRRVGARILRTSAAPAWRVRANLGDGEGRRIRLPDVLLVVVVLRCDDDAVGHKESRVEPDT